MATIGIEVESAFRRIARGLRRWDDPHPPPDRVVADEEYSRLRDPERWRIVGARADAWAEALVAVGAARFERAASVVWLEAPGTVTARVDLLVPTVPGGIVVAFGRSRIGDVADAGLTLGVADAVGEPFVAVHVVPDCGCDACDSGSRDVVDEVDTWMGGIVDGSFRHLVSRFGTVTVRSAGLRGASAPGVMRFDPDEVLRDPSGWREWSGPPWLAGVPPRVPH